MSPASINLAGRGGKNLWRFGYVLLLFLLLACSSKGTAPVYNRNPAQAPARAAVPADFYQVKRGDTLYSIAWRYRLDYHRLAAWNRIGRPHYRIYPGQRLRLKPPPKRKRPADRPASRPKHQAPPVKTSAPVATQRVKGTSPQVTLAKDGPSSLKLIWRWPTNGRVIQTYSATDPARKGIWIRGVSGQPVVATEAGKVVYSGGGLVGYGNLIIVKHNNKYLSAYGYNKKLLVKEGDKVKRGEQIARMGSPRNGADPILHFEIRKYGNPINPLPLLPR